MGRLNRGIAVSQSGKITIKKSTAAHLVFVLDLNTFLSLVVCPHYFVPSPSSASTTQHSRCQNTLANIFCWLFLLLHTLHFFPLLCHSHLLTVVTPLPCPSSPAPGAFRRPYTLSTLASFLVFPLICQMLHCQIFFDFFLLFWVSTLTCLICTSFCLINRALRGVS